MRVYVAGPYTLGDVALNVRQAITAADQLMRKGHIPFVPHLSHFWHMMYPHEYSTWLWYTSEWLKVCGAVVRLKGESKGSDMEEAWARSRNIPVFYSVDEFITWHYNRYGNRPSPEPLKLPHDANSPGSRQPTSQDNDSRGSAGTERGQGR